MARYFPGQLRGQLQHTISHRVSRKLLILIQQRRHNKNSGQAISHSQRAQKQHHGDDIGPHPTHHNTHLRRIRIHASSGSTPFLPLAFGETPPLPDLDWLPTPFPSSTDTLSSCRQPVDNKPSTAPPALHAVDTKEAPCFINRDLPQVLDIAAAAAAAASTGHSRGVSWHLRYTNPVELKLSFSTSSTLPVRHARAARGEARTWTWVGRWGVLSGYIRNCAEDYNQ